MADSQDDTTLKAGGNQAVTLTLGAYLQSIFNEVEENLEYITEVEGIEIPKVWQQKILQPIAFAIGVAHADDQVSDLAGNNPDTNNSSSNPPATNPINTEVSDGYTKK